MASGVATPLERQFGRIAGVSEMTSSSRLGSTSVVLQFVLDRDINAAARDVQAAINAARGQLPPDLPGNPTYRKVNPADAPAMILSLTSDTVPRARLYDIASSVVAQRLSQVEGVGQVNVGGGALPAVRVELNPHAGEVRPRLRSGPNACSARRMRTGPRVRSSDATTTFEIGATDQLFKAADYEPLIVAYRNGAPIRLADLGERPGLGPGHPRHRAHERQAGGPAAGVPPDRRQHHRDGRPRQGVAAGVPRAAPRRGRSQRRHRPHDHHPRLGRRTSSARSCWPILLVVLVVFVFLRSRPHDHHSGHRRAAVAARHVRRDVLPRLQPRQPVADGVDDLDRLRRGRRDRGDRERQPSSGSRSDAARRPRCWAPRKSASRSSR